MVLNRAPAIRCRHPENPVNAQRMVVRIRIQNVPVVLRMEESARIASAKAARIASTIAPKSVHLDVQIAVTQIRHAQTADVRSVIPVQIQVV